MTPQTPPPAETILIAEDEEAVRRILSVILTRAGYVVLEAENGVQALSVLRRHEGPVHLLVTDVVMPAMGGPKLAREAGQDRPDLKVLFISGYTDDPVVWEQIDQDAERVLLKPFPSSTLMERVRSMLDRPLQAAAAA